MNLLDRLALSGRRYERRQSPTSNRSHWDLSEILRTYGRKAIVELTVRAPRQADKTLKPDSERKLKISLLDVISDIQPGEGGRYEVFETAPSGDLSKVRIVAHSASGESKGELWMLMGRRTLDSYFLEDPILDSINQHSAGQA